MHSKVILLWSAFSLYKAVNLVEIFMHLVLVHDWYIMYKIIDFLRKTAQYAEF